MAPRNKQYAYLLNDTIEFARSYNDNKDVKVKATTVKLLYSQLLCYGNSKMWNLPFKLSIRDLQSLTSCKPQTITSARNELKRRGKIFFANLDDTTYYTFPDKNGMPIITDENFMKVHEKRNQNVAEIMLSKGEPKVTQESPKGEPKVTQESPKGEPKVNQESPKGEPKVNQRDTVKRFDQMPSEASNQPKNDIANSPPTTTTTTKTTTTTTSITTSITPVSKSANFDSETTTEKTTPDEMHYNENDIQTETEKIDGLIDFSVGQEKNLGGEAAEPYSVTTEKNGSTTTKSFEAMPTIQPGSILKSIADKYGIDTVNQAKSQIEEQQKRTGRTDLITNSKYWETTCQRILGMTDTNGILTKKDKHNKENVGGGWVQPEMTEADKCFALIQETLEANDPDLINTRYAILVDEFDKHYDTVTNPSPKEMLEILHPILKEYQARGIRDKEYKAKKKARGKW